MTSNTPQMIIEITRGDLDDMLEAAAEKGASRALKNLGLSDEQAAHDIRDLRELIKSWKEVRSAALTTAVKIITTGILGIIVLGLGVKFGLKEFFGS